MRENILLYGGFNARNLSPKQVAEDFVPNEAFYKLLANAHNILMGPRGSGKTTLLKMLTLEALFSWRRKEARRILNEIPFIAVYVPTDIHWSHQIDNSIDLLNKATKGFKNGTEIAELFSKASITTNIFSSLCNAMESCLQYKILRQENKLEQKLCKNLYEIFGLKKDVLSLSFLRFALKKRLSEIRDWESKVRTSCNEKIIRNLPSFFHYDYLAKLDVSCEIFEAIYLYNKNKFKWALCFDELEIAPGWLQDKLFKAVRSTEERFLFKLGTSPIPEYISSALATPRDDFIPIELWPDSQDRNPTTFASELALSVIKSQNISVDNPYEVFGYSPFSSKYMLKRGVREYGQGSFVWGKIKEEASCDEDLRKLLESSEISPDNPTGNKQQLDTILRKIKPIILYRNSNRKYDRKGKPKPRTRKISELYCGFDVITDVCEGNPRWLKGALQDLLAKADKKGKVPLKAQARVLHDISENYWAKLKVIPESKKNILGRNIFMTQFLEKLAKFFFEEIVLSKFSINPIGSFEVDRLTPQNYADFIKKASEHGALISIQKGIFSSDFYNRRFRLSYMLAPSFKLPLRLYEPIKLSVILGLAKNIKKSKKDENQLELELGFKKENRDENTRD